MTCGDRGRDKRDLEVNAGRAGLQYRHGLCAVMAVAMLVGCGGDKSGSAGGPAAAKIKADRAPNATAEEVAAEARDGLRCPPTLKSPPRAAGAPVDDILGVRRGLTLEEARQLVLCSHEMLVATEETSRGFDLPAGGKSVRQGFSAQFAKPRVERTGRQIAQDMQDEAMGRGLNRLKREVGPGQSKWYVGTMGMPGMERVITAAREEWFDAGREPTVDTVSQALIAKYGPATRTEGSGSWHRLSWTYDASGQRLAEGSRLYPICRANPSPDSGLNLNADCGLTIEAAMNSLPDNPALVQFLQVSVLDQAQVYAAVQSTKQGLEGQEAERREQQVKDASSNAAAPRL